MSSSHFGHSRTAVHSKNLVKIICPAENVALGTLVVVVALDRQLARYSYVYEEDISSCEPSALHCD